MKGMTRGAEPRERGGPFLTVIANHKEVQRKPLVGTTTIGRSLDCDVWIEDLALSRRHCQLEEALEGDGWVVTDLGSRNGTYVNAKRITERTPLNDRDIITIGKAHIKFHARGYMPQRPAGVEEALKMPANRAAMKVTHAGGSSNRPLPTPRVSNADTISPGESINGGTPSPAAPDAPDAPKPLPFTRPPARPIVKPEEEEDE